MNPINQSSSWVKIGLILSGYPDGKLQSVNDPRLGGIVGGHFHSDAITHCQANEAFTHLAGNMGKHEVLIGQSDPEHRAG